MLVNVGNCKNIGNLAQHMLGISDIIDKLLSVQ